jgi:hypothetical protein
MIDALVQLQHLRQQIRAAVDKLAAEAEREPEAAPALACVHLASECQKLERLIAQLSNEVLKDQRSEGTA